MNILCSTIPTLHNFFLPVHLALFTQSVVKVSMHVHNKYELVLRLLCDYAFKGSLVRSMGEKDQYSVVERKRN